MMNLQVPIWCVSHRRWCASDIHRSDITSLVLVSTERGASAAPLFSSVESVDRFNEIESDGTAKFAVCCLANVDALRQFLEYVQRSGVTYIVVDPLGASLQFKVDQLIDELPSDEDEFHRTVYRSDYFHEWDQRHVS